MQFVYLRKTKDSPSSAQLSRAIRVICRAKVAWMNKKIAIARQRPKPCVVVGMDRGSATRVKWEFMKDSKGMFDTHQLSL